MTPEEVWREAQRASENCACQDFGSPDQAAVSVIRTAMEAYAAEKVAEERAAIVAWLRELSGHPASALEGYPPRGEVWVLHRAADAIAANQHHGGNDD